MKDYKIGLIVFLFLATIISLFPPFEWSDKNTKTEKERVANKIVVENTPLKRYDLLFAASTKLFPFESHFENSKVYKGEKPLIDTSDAIFIKKEKGIDTFFINTWYREYNENDKEAQRLWDLGNKFLSRMYRVSQGFAEEKINNFKKIEENAGNSDTIKSFVQYEIKKPYWFLLQRNLIISELVVEYVLAFCLSMIANFSYNTLRKRKIS